MIGHDRYRHQRRCQGLDPGGRDRLGAGWRQCHRHWPGRRRPAGRTAPTPDPDRHSCCDCSSDCMRRRSNAIAAGIWASTRRRHSSPLGLLEDVARASNDTTRSARRRRDVGGVCARTQRNGGGILSHKTFGQATLQIVLADFSMSLDNVLAVAGAARDQPLILAFGLLLSICLMGVAANFIGRLLQNHRWIAYVGLAIILYVACEMIYRGAYELKLAIN